MLTDEIRNELFRLKDDDFREFHSRLIPTVAKETIIGVRTPDLRSYAKELFKAGDVSRFTNNLPHKYYDENQLHVYLLNEIKDFDECIKEVERFLPYIDNWAACDQLRPKVFVKNKVYLLPYINKWLASDKVYTIRFAIELLMIHFLDEEFNIKYVEQVASVHSDEYYIDMMIAWYFATALAKQYDAVIPFIENRRLTPPVHKKAIQKAVESYRITPEQKKYLRSLR